jgi:hypothetical protein
MKTWVFKSAVILSLLAMAFPARSAGQLEATNGVTSTNGIGPKIQFEATTYDFGRALAGTQVKHDFVFTNTGDATLKITGVQPGCGCTTIGEWTHEVDPGKTGVIPIQFNSTMYNGSVIKHPSITCNDKAQPMVGFTLRGTLYKIIEFSPPYVIFNIPPDADQDTNGVVHIVNNDTEPLTLQAPTSNQGAFTAELRTNVPGKDFSLIVKTVPPLPPGSSPGMITIGTSSKSTPAITVSVVAILKPLMTAMPAALTIPAGPITNSESIAVFLQNQGSRPVKLSEPSVNASGVEASISTSRPGQVFAVSVTFPNGFQMPAGKPLTLTVKTDNPRFPVMEVPIRQATAAIAPPPPPQNIRAIAQ